MKGKSTKKNAKRLTTISVHLSREKVVVGVVDADALAHVRAQTRQASGTTYYGLVYSHERRSSMYAAYQPRGYHALPRY